MSKLIGTKVSTIEHGEPKVGTKSLSSNTVNGTIVEAFGDAAHERVLLVILTEDNRLLERKLREVTVLAEDSKKTAKEAA